MRPGRRFAHPLEREQHAGHVRLPRERVVADRQQLPLARQQHFLVRDEAGQAHGVDRDVAAHRLGGRLGRPGRRIDLRLVVRLDDLCARQVLRCLRGEAHHQHRAEREVRRVEDGDSDSGGALPHLGEIGARRTDDRRDAGIDGGLDVRDDSVRRREVDHHVGLAEIVHELVTCRLERRREHRPDLPAAPVEEEPHRPIVTGR